MLIDRDENHSAELDKRLESRVYESLLATVIPSLKTRDRILCNRDLDSPRYSLGYQPIAVFVRSPARLASCGPTKYQLAGKILPGYIALRE